MKVLHVIPSLNSRWGGPSKVILEMTKYLMNSGVDVEIATTHFYDEKPVIGEVKTHSFPSYFHGNYSPKFRKWIKNNLEKYDLVHISGIFHEATYYTAKMAKKKKIPYIIRPMGQLYDWSMKNRNYRLKMFFLKLNPNLFSNASAIQYTAQDEIDNLFIKINSKRFIISEGVDIPEFVSKKKFKELFPELDCKILLFLSRIHPKKGLHIFIPIISDLLKDSEFKFVIAGNGSEDYINKLKSIIEKYHLKDKIIFVGFVKGERKNALLYNSSAFILPSFTENFGIAVVEAMLAGLPVAISKNVGIASEIKDSAVVFDLSKKSMRNAFIEITRLKIGEKGIKLAIKNYSWESVTKRIIEMYEKIL